MTLDLHFELRATPLHLRTSAANIRNLWRAWRGYTVPQILSGLAHEVDAARNACAIADLTPLSLLRLSGKDTAQILSRALTRDAAALEQGKAAAVLWCDESGFVRGQGALARLDAENFFIVSRTEDEPFFRAVAGDTGVALANDSDATVKIALMGPDLGDMLIACGLKSELLKQQTCLATQVCNLNATLIVDDPDRDALIVVAPDDALLMWDRLARAGRAFGIAPIGMDALDILRLEDGAPLDGIDFAPAHIAETDAARATPFELGLDDLVEDTGRQFNGRRALAELKSAPPARKLAALLSSGTFAGRISSSCFSPSLQSVVTLAWLDAAALANPKSLAPARLIEPRRPRLFPF